MKIKQIIEHINGDSAYRNYLKHLKDKHPNKKPLSKKEFFLKQQDEKWTRINRCC